MPERRRFSCSPRCVVVRKEPGWSGALQQLPSQARSCDVRWGTNPALDTPFPKVQKEWRKQGSRPEWCSQPCPAILHFLSALPWESSNEAKTQNRDKALEAVRCSCHVFQHLTVAPGAGEGWQGSFLRSHLRTQGGTQLSPSQMMGQQGTWEQGEGAHRQIGLCAFGQMWHPDPGQHSSPAAQLRVAQWECWGHSCLQRDVVWSILETFSSLFPLFSVQAM